MWLTVEDKICGYSVRNSASLLSQMKVKATRSDGASTQISSAVGAHSLSVSSCELLNVIFIAQCGETLLQVQQ